MIRFGSVSKSMCNSIFCETKSVTQKVDSVALGRQRPTEVGPHPSATHPHCNDCSHKTEWNKKSAASIHQDQCHRSKLTPKPFWFDLCTKCQCSAMCPTLLRCQEEWYEQLRNQASYLCH